MDDHRPDPGPDPLPPPARKPPGLFDELTPEGLLQLCVAHNPFYLISAALILYGLHVAGWARGRWTMLALLGGYTALMVAAGVLIVRLGRVWDDARSIVLIVVVLLLAISVGFDDVTIDTLHARHTATAQLLVGLGVAMALSEALLGGMGIRAPWVVRGPYHLLLALFYLYPILLSEVVRIVHAGNKPLLSRALYGWSAGAALVLLTLIPAARRGPRLARDNGTPWAWPAFPWAVFALIGAAVGLRSWLFCNSYLTGLGVHDPFGAYLLAPLVLAVGVLLLEAGVAGDRRGLRLAALAAPIVAIALSLPGTNGNLARQELLAHVRAALAGPAWMATLAAAGFYLLAWSRRVRGAEGGVIGALLLLTVVTPTTVAWREVLVRPSSGSALVGAGVYLLISLGWDRVSWRALAGMACLLWSAFGAPDTSWLARWHGLGLLSLLAGGMLVIGVLFEDLLARALRLLAAPLLAGLLVAALFFAGEVAASWPGWVLWLYVLAMVAVPGAYACVAERPGLPAPAGDSGRPPAAEGRGRDGVAAPAA